MKTENTRTRNETRKYAVMRAASSAAGYGSAVYRLANGDSLIYEAFNGRRGGVRVEVRRVAGWIAG